MSTAMNEKTFIYTEDDVNSLLSEFTSPSDIMQKYIEAQEKARGMISNSALRIRKLVSIEIYARRL